MKKFFIFLFAVFLTTFIGCKTGFGGSSEIPNSETTEETTGKTTVETNGEETTPKTFEVFALDNSDNILTEAGKQIGIEKINTEFNLGKTDESNFVCRYFYRRIKINGIIYTIKGLKIKEDNSNYYSLVEGPFDIQIGKDATNDYEYYFPTESIPLKFIDFYMGKPILFKNTTTTILFSDLYEKVN